MRSCSRSAAGVCATVRVGLTVGFGAGDAVWNRPISPQAESATARTAAAAQPKGGGLSSLPCLVPSRTLRHFSYPVVSGELIPAAQNSVCQFNLPHPEHLNPRPAPRLDPAADANPPIFEGLKGNAGGLERRQHAP